MKNILFLGISIIILSCDNNLNKKYYNNGALKSEYYCDENGLKSGVFKEYYENKNPKIECNYIKDTLNGIYKEFFSNGNPSIITSFSKGKQNGSLLEYFENGKLLQKSEYKLGVKNGLILFYYQNGNKLSESLVKEGKTQYRFDYDSLGTTIKRQHKIEIFLLNSISKNDQIRIKAKIMGFYDFSTSVFTFIEKQGEMIEGDIPKMVFNKKDSCYYYNFVPQNSMGQYRIQVSLLIDNEFLQRRDTLISIQ